MSGCVIALAKLRVLETLLANESARLTDALLMLPMFVTTDANELTRDSGLATILPKVDILAEIVPNENA